MKNTEAFFLAVFGIGAVGACAHQQAAKDATANSGTAQEQAASTNPTPSTDPLASNRSKAEEQDLSALLQGTLLHFDFDQSSLTAESRSRLQKLADVLREHRTLEVKISGHCDERGTEEYNLALGQQRAGAAKKYLVDLGIEANRIDTISYGKERPLDPRHTEEAWALNRRDEFTAAGGP